MIPIVILLISFFNSSEVAAKLNNETDRLALLAFKDLISEDPRGSLSSWNDSLSLCKWIGVTCGRRLNRVTSLDLRSQGLAGLISPSIGNLTFLRSVHLGDNQLRGTIPTEIVHLPHLQHLNLSLNSIEGELPSHMPNSSHLRVADFAYNNLTGKIPGLFGSLSQLTYLAFFENKLTGRIPSSLGNLTFLQSLSLGFNSLIGTIPDSLGHLTNLVFINAGMNNLTGVVPPSLYNISSLENLIIAGSNFSGSLPLDIGLTLPNLETISTGGNQLSGSFPISLSNASRMVILSIPESGLMGSVPVDIGKRMNDLQWLDLSWNNLGSGREDDLRFVDSLRNCSKLTIFDISGNGFEGVLPKSLGNLSTELSILMARENEFVGTIPVGICNLVNLATLQLDSNNLFGPIPFEIGKLRSLHQLYLSENKLAGPVPSSMANLSQIFELVLSDNILTGGISIITDNIPGQFSSVFKGILQLIKKPIAVKVLNLDMIGASKSFIAECEALRIARHRNLLKIITTCSSVTFKGEDFKALVFEFMLNGSLELWLHHNHYDGLHERSLDFCQRLNIAIGVASALDYLHHQCKPPIVHCDLKPGNILLDESMIPHVGDFGLARFLTLNTSDGGAETSSIAVKGTIGYVPPEYGLGGQVSTEGDVYSYGILLLEMLTGKKPTDEVFGNNLSLHDYCRRAWPERIKDIMDSRLLYEPNDDKQAREESRMIECVCSLLSIGIACSAELPNERMDMKNVVIKLNVAEEVFLGIGIYGLRHMRMGDAGEGPSKLVRD